MENRFFLYGIAGLLVIPVFTLTYLQNELPKGSISLLISQSRLFNQTAMFFSFCLLFLHTLPVGQLIGIVISILLITALSISINYTYHEYTIDEGEKRKNMLLQSLPMSLQASISPSRILLSTRLLSSSSA